MENIYSWIGEGLALFYLIEEEEVRIVLPSNWSSIRAPECIFWELQLVVGPLRRAVNPRLGSVNWKRLSPGFYTLYHRKSGMSLCEAGVTDGFQN